MDLVSQSTNVLIDAGPESRVISSKGNDWGEDYRCPFGFFISYFAEKELSQLHAKESYIVPTIPPKLVWICIFAILYIGNLFDKNFKPAYQILHSTTYSFNT